MSAEEIDPADLIDARIAELDDWRGSMLSQLRDLVLMAVPDVLEEVKWRKPTNPLGVPTWYSNGLVCTGEVYRDKVKVTFAKGASVADPDGLFNSSLDGNTRRAIDFFEGDTVDADAFMALLAEASALNAV